LYRLWFTRTAAAGAGIAVAYLAVALCPGALPALWDLPLDVVIADNLPLRLGGWILLVVMAAFPVEGQVLLPGYWITLASVAAMSALALVLLAGKDKDHPRSAPSPIQKVQA
ncbi:hypothetical protein AAH991_39565, partial [Microbispora sp. ZYX-F-249]